MTIIGPCIVQYQVSILRMYKVIFHKYKKNKANVLALIAQPWMYEVMTNVLMYLENY